MSDLSQKDMSRRQKLVYIGVQDEQMENVERNKRPFRYTMMLLQNTLHLMGCKPRHAFKISKRVFEVVSSEFLAKQGFTSQETECYSGGYINDTGQILEGDGPPQGSIFVVHREHFLDVVCDCLTAYRYMGPTQRDDLILACKIRERKLSLTIFLCGTSGCGKSTLSTLLASRLGFTTVVSTDSIRHMMRSFVDEKDNPILWASTYQAGEYLDPVIEAEAKKKEKRMAEMSDHAAVRDPIYFQQNFGIGECLRDYSHGSMKTAIGAGYRSTLLHEGNIDSEEMAISSRMMAVQGYKAQSGMVIERLDRLITSWEHKYESVIVEGVHLSLNFVVELMKKHPSILPFMIYIANAEKHQERFAIRAKYMTLDPSKNKYVKYIHNIRAIQNYLSKRADKYMIPKINNTNVDRSVAAIHATIFSCLRRRECGEPFFDGMTKTVKMVDEQYRKCSANFLSSKGMFKILQRRGSSRQIMALANTDKFFEEKNKDSLDSEKVTSKFTDETLATGPVNVQFGNFGLGCWSMDGKCPTHSNVIDEVSSKKKVTVGTRNDVLSSCSSSPRLGDGTLIESEPLSESSVLSDEESEESNPTNSDKDLDRTKELLEDGLQASVDEESSGSEEHGEELGTVDEYCSANSTLTCIRIGKFEEPDNFLLPKKKYPHRVQLKYLHCGFPINEVFGEQGFIKWNADRQT